VKEWELNCFLKSRKGEESEFQGAVSGTLEPCSSALEQQLARATAGQDAAAPTATQQPALESKTATKLLSEDLWRIKLMTRRYNHFAAFRTESCIDPPATTPSAGAANRHPGGALRTISLIWRERCLC
jgi:hypothetical protein